MLPMLAQIIVKAKVSTQHGDTSPSGKLSAMGNEGGKAMCTGKPLKDFKQRRELTSVSKRSLWPLYGQCIVGRQVGRPGRA